MMLLPLLKLDDQKTAMTPSSDYMPYREKTALEICRQLAEGVALHQICQKDGMPSYENVMKWRVRSSRFRQMINYARMDAMGLIESKIRQIVDQISDKDEAAAAKVKIDALKWLAIRLEAQLPPLADEHENEAPKDKRSVKEIEHSIRSKIKELGFELP